uniref:Cationic amino acid transporter C-terminal domain-containing protein n=1 Tax=Salix viminalis TaxID=40686 RepID=A0A6N2MNE9_SALVM
MHGTLFFSPKLYRKYLIAAGAPRILMAMARDGLLPSFFSDVNRRSQVPVKSTLVTGLGSAVLAFFMDVSVGTLLAFTMVAISVLILRYVPPDEVPFPSSLQEIIDSVSLRHSTGCQNVTKEKRKITGWTITATCVGAFLLAYAASDLNFFVL